MAREIRFTELVRTSGNPQTVVLWTNPKKDKPLMQAVRENRVLTVIQKPTGTAKDFAQIGFHQQRFAQYLIFPRPLPKNPEVHVIGIRYELIKEPESKAPAPSPPPKPAKKIQPVVTAKPQKKQFSVSILRLATVEVAITLSALSIADAENQALENVKRQKFAPEEIQDEIKSINEI